MAKLTARNRKELVRVTKIIACEDADRLISSERLTIALMSDGKILRKRDVVFRSDGTKHSYGWKVFGKAKAGVTAERFAEVYLSHGYTVG